jgi:succinate dehydrogenase/fumarate reductase flavoprotein subunit
LTVQRLVFRTFAVNRMAGIEKGNKLPEPSAVSMVTVKGEIAGDEFARIVRNLEGRELIDEKTGQACRLSPSPVRQEMARLKDILGNRLHGRLSRRNFARLR